MGHIVLVHIHNRLVLHRVIRKKNNQIHIRGDAELRKSDTIAPHQIIGIAASRQRNQRLRRLDTLPARLIGCLWHAVRHLRILAYNVNSFQRQTTNIQRPTSK